MHGKNRWSTRVGRVESSVGEIGSELDGKADAESVDTTFTQHESWSAQRREEINEVSERVGKVEQRLDGIDQRLGEITAALEERPTTDEVIEASEALRDDLEAQIEDARGVF